jgi:glyoxylase-like metal-dependent hydrolase (beta-lactamase superfamily II)
MRAIAFAVLFAAGSVFAQQDFSKVQIKVQKVAGNVYMLEGSGGNIGVSAGEDGIVIVDNQFAPLADKIQAALKGIVDKPVRFVINTHWHFDHTGGNEYFQKQGTILAHENVRERLLKGQKVLNFDIKPAPAGALPIITFSERASIHLNGEEIRAIHFAAGHTDGDAIIFFPKSNVVHMGDDYFNNGGFPFVDLASGGSVRGMIAACEKVIAIVPADSRVIPGHGPLSNIPELKAYVAMLKETVARVEAGIKAGRSAEDLKKANVLKGYESFGAPGKFISTDLWIDTLYNDLSGKKAGEAVKHN